MVALANAGGRSLSAQESAQFLALFRRYCSNPSSSPSQDGNTFFYCKTSDQPAQTLTIDHSADVDAGQTPKQVIFVQPPPTNYVHNVALRGSPGNPQETEIYVLPSSAEHTLQVQDTRSAVQAQKPSLYFLNQDGNQGNPRPGVLPGGQGGNLGGNDRRPSSPPPSDPAVIGIGSGLGSGGYPNQPQPQQQQQQYVQYGAPGVLAPRNQRNIKTNAYRTI